MKGKNFMSKNKKPSTMTKLVSGYSTKLKIKYSPEKGFLGMLVTELPTYSGKERLRATSLISKFGEWSFFYGNSDKHFLNVTTKSVYLGALAAEALKVDVAGKLDKEETLELIGSCTMLVNYLDKKGPDFKFEEPIEDDVEEEVDDSEDIIDELFDDEAEESKEESDEESDEEEPEEEPVKEEEVLEKKPEEKPEEKPKRKRKRKVVEAPENLTEKVEKLIVETNPDMSLKQYFFVKKEIVNLILRPPKDIE